jgi:hypothetical protein
MLDVDEPERPSAEAAPQTSATAPARARRSIHRSLVLVMVSDVTALRTARIPKSGLSEREETR